MTTAKRRLVIKALQDAGREACLAGRSRNPPLELNGTMDLGHWLDGWDAAKEEQEREERLSSERTLDEEGAELRLRFRTALTEYTTAPTQVAAYRLDEAMIAWEDYIVKRSQHGDRESN